tara:strand:- start:1621 stop:1938 length:318 start_codon:yes stop_codon:yes gene_type:complete
MKRTQEQFEAEIAAARKVLEARGRVGGSASLGASEESAVKSDYELPYSSLPKIIGTKWFHSEKIGGVSRKALLAGGQELKRFRPPGVARLPASLRNVDGKMKETE